MSNNNEIYNDTMKMNKELYAFIYPGIKNAGKETETVFIGQGGSGIRRVLNKVRERLGMPGEMISTEDLSKMEEHLYGINSGETITKAEIVAQAFHLFLEFFGADEAIPTNLLGLVNMKMAQALMLPYLKRTTYIADRPNATPEQTPSVQYWGLVNYVLCEAYYIIYPVKFYFKPENRERVKEVKKGKNGMHRCLPPPFKKVEHEMVSSVSKMIVNTEIECTTLSKTVLRVITLLACIELQKKGYSVKKALTSSLRRNGAAGIKRKASDL